MIKSKIFNYNNFHYGNYGFDEPTDMDEQSVILNLHWHKIGEIL